MASKNDWPVAITCALGIALGGSLLWAYQTDGKAAAAAGEIKALKDSNRSAWQKVYDLQEKESDRIEAAEGETSVWKWKYEQSQEALGVCEKGNK